MNEMSVAEISWFIIRYLVCLCCELSLWWLTRYYIYSKVVINGVDSFRFSGHNVRFQNDIIDV